MPHPLEQTPEFDTAPLYARIASLEKIICELLTKNQRLRCALQHTLPERGGDELVSSSWF